MKNSRNVCKKLYHNMPVHVFVLLLDIISLIYIFGVSFIIYSEKLFNINISHMNHYFNMS